MQRVLQSIPGVMSTLSSFIAEYGSELFQESVFKMKKDLQQIDLIRDVAIPLNARMLADLFYLDLHTPENVHGSLSHAELYNHLLNIRIWGTVGNSDSAMAWNRRRWAQEGATAITESTQKIVQKVADERESSGIALYLSSLFSKYDASSIKQGSLRSYGRQIVEGLLAEGESVEEIVDTLWLICFGGIGAPVTAVS